MVYTIHITLCLIYYIGIFMASYVKKSLMNGETIIAAAKVSIVSQFIPYFDLEKIAEPGYWGIKLVYWGVNFKLWFIPTILLAVINVMTTELAVTNKKIIGKVGFIRRIAIDLPLTKIESINVDQGIFGRFFDYGKLAVCGIGGRSITIPNIKNPFVFRQEVLNFIDDKQV